MNFQKLTDYIDTLEQHGIPGCDCIIYYQHKEVYRHTQGYSDNEKTKPVSGDDLYWLYSATKPITCTAAMQLIENGKMDLDDPVSKYLPAFSKLTVRKGDSVVPAEKVMTLRHLMTMTAGLNYDLYMKPVREVQEQTAGKASTQEIVNAMAREPLSFEPSTHYQYSLCHDVLAGVVEVASGKSFGDYLDEHIFAPLGIKNAGFHLTEGKRRRMSALYEYHQEKQISNEVPGNNIFVLSDCYESGGAGLFCTAEDYIKFADALCNNGEGANGTVILTRDSVDQMRHDELAGDCIEDFKQLGKYGYSYGLGVRTLTNPAASRSPVGEFGWDGAAGSYVVIDPVNHIAIFYAQHILGCYYAYQTIHPTIRDLTYEILEV